DESTEDGMLSTPIVMVTDGVAPGVLVVLVATLPTSTTVPGCTVPSGNSTSILAPSANVASPTGGVVVTCREGAVNDWTTLSPARTVPSGTRAAPTDRPDGPAKKAPGGVATRAALDGCTRDAR